MSKLTVEEACGKMLNRAERRARGLTTPKRTVKHCHVEVKKVAEGMAHVLFDELMSRNEVFHQFKRQHEGLSTAQMEALFVAHLWPQLLDQARATLAGMLRSPTYSEEMKEDIMDILVKDQSLVRGRKNPALLLGQS